MDKTLLIKKQNNGVTTLTLNREKYRNAFDDKLINLLLTTLKKINEDPSVRVVVLTGAGEHFSAGADLHWMKRMADYTTEENYQDAQQLARLMRILDELKKPTIALTQGATIGGAVGLISCCDIVIAAPNSFFCLSEVKLGLSPAVISPYVIQAIGVRAMRRYALTAEPIDAPTAKHIGLIHEIADSPSALAETLIEKLLTAGPQAITKTKQLLQQIKQTAQNDELTARTIAEIRSSEEGREGINAFLTKRQPNWKINV